MPRPPIDRRGMTLVELLVVVGIILTLFVAVAPNLVNTAEARRSREAARMVSSFLAKAQSRALGNPEWSGFTVVASSPTSFAAVDLALADVPPVYRGDTVPALLTITGSDTTTRTASSATAVASLLAVGGTTGDLIRFEGRGPFYQLDNGQPVTGTSVRFEFRGHESAAVEDAGFQRHNTPWPPEGVPMSFEVFLRPIPAGSPFRLPEGQAIDLYWSGYGPPQANSIAAYKPFDQAGARVSGLFDGTGRLRQIVEITPTATNRRTVTGPLFFLVGRVDRAGQAFATLDAANDTLGANWQYPDSWWIAIDPMTGVVKSAECTFFGEDDNRNGILDANEDRNGNNALDVDVIASQRWIRRALLGTGR